MWYIKAWLDTIKIFEILRLFLDCIEWNVLFRECFLCFLENFTRFILFFFRLLSYELSVLLLGTGLYRRFHLSIVLLVGLHHGYHIWRCFHIADRFQKVYFCIFRVLFYESIYFWVRLAGLLQSFMNFLVLLQLKHFGFGLRKRFK